ncbi:pyrroline-5-carboxylate reductase [Alphaproteobacteria bacterium GH1-50]|uniref:Pyrroline-5-carboxylate reductase n=1 Tax=Kangsaoukella pontilimi TaxID=2691042 RepID=A0A7C9IQ06_9RHOB|nr:pyrroline-5-carboxylate reductase [Kangsaoukella pontilimi]MXQ08650.1 pyrroline-5-carboxylate reductase [Kangsaoukella pontilimi]
MNQDEISERGLVLLGCGKMGGAMLKGWLAGGLPAASVWVIDPAPAPWLTEAGVRVNEELPEAPAMTILAVKPQMMGDALPQVAALSGRTVFLSIAAGTTIATLEAELGGEAAVIRAMPNTPAAVGRGITAIIGNQAVDEGALSLAEDLLGAVGQTVRLDDEAQMDAVTAVSGSGPAYVFHLIEVLAAAGEAEGLTPELAMALARATVGGAGVLAEEADETPSELRVNVTSPGGTTQAALEVLMDAETGFPPLLKRAVAAAARRSRELGQ